MLNHEQLVHTYRISGLSVASELELPGAIPATAHDSPDVTVSFGEVPQRLAEATASGPTWQRQGNTLLLSVPGLVRILVSDGRSIVVAIEAGASAHDASAFVLGSALGILLHQRGELVLHASAVARDGRAIVLCGHSGAGKSTTAAALCERGFSFVSDDICVLRLNQNGLPVVLPDGRQLKLWRNSIDGLELEQRRGEAVRETFEKFFVAPGVSVIEPPLLAAIYVLRESRAPFTDGIEPMGLADAMRAIEREAYRPMLRRELSSQAAGVSQAAAILSHTRMFHFTRPLGFGRLDPALDALVGHWEGL